jgi:hypothetical protein
MEENSIIQPEYVCLLAETGLVALDPSTGKLLWCRGDVAPGSAVYGDASHLLLIEPSQSGEQRTRCFRAADGREIMLPDAGKTPEGRVAILGTRLLLHESGEDAEILKLHDVVTGTDVWEQKFPAGATLLHNVDTTLTGMVDHDGQVRICDAASGKVLLQPRLDPQHLENAAAVHLTGDRNLFLILIQRKLPDNIPQSGPNMSWETGVRTLSVNGQIYAFDRESGKLRWRFFAPQAAIVLDSMQDLPFLVLTSRYQQPLTSSLLLQSPQDFCQVRVIDKKTGKRLYDEKDLQGAPPFHTWHMDFEKRTLELVSDRNKLTIEWGK